MLLAFKFARFRNSQMRVVPTGEYQAIFMVFMQVAHQPPIKLSTLKHVTLTYVHGSFNEAKVKCQNMQKYLW